MSFTNTSTCLHQTSPPCCLITSMKTNTLKTTSTVAPGNFTTISIPVLLLYTCGKLRGSPWQPKQARLGMLFTTGWGWTSTLRPGAQNLYDRRMIELIQRSGFEVSLQRQLKLNSRLSSSVKMTLVSVKIQIIIMSIQHMLIC